MISEGFAFPERTFLVDPVRVEEFVIATGVAPEPGWTARPGAPLPLGFLMYVTTYGAEPIHEMLGLDMTRTLFAGTHIEHVMPVRIGDLLTVRPSIAKIVDRDGPRGRSVWIEVMVEYLDPTGVLRVRERSTVIQRG